ncbi:MAG: DMT family transporter [Bacteroidales bacterium]
MFNRLRTSPYLAYIALVFGILCIGHSAIFITLAGVPGSTASFYRIFFATLAILPIWFYRGMKVPTRKDLGLILLGGSFFALDFVLWNTAIILTTAATATLLANNAPVWVGLISFFVFKERLTKKFWVGLAVALIGINVLLGMEAWRTMAFARGDLLALAAGFLYALYLILTIDSRKRVDTITFMTFSLIFMTVMLFFTNLAMGNPFVGFSKGTWYSLGAVGLISHFGGWLCINFALGHLKGANVSVTLLSQSVITAILGFFILNQKLEVNQIVGGLILLSGIYIVNRRRTKIIK